MWFSCFPVLPGSAEAQVIWGGIVKRLLSAYFIGNISAKKYQNPFMCVKVIASQRWDVFETRCRWLSDYDKSLTCFINCLNGCNNTIIAYRLICFWNNQISNFEIVQFRNSFFPLLNLTSRRVGSLSASSQVVGVLACRPVDRLPLKRPLKNKDWRVSAAYCSLCTVSV